MRDLGGGRYLIVAREAAIIHGYEKPRRHWPSLCGRIRPAILTGPPVPDPEYIRLSRWLRSGIPGDMLVAFDDHAGEAYLRAEGKLYLVPYAILENALLSRPHSLMEQVTSLGTVIGEYA